MENHYRRNSPIDPSGCHGVDAPEQIVLFEPNTNTKSEMYLNSFKYGVVKKKDGKIVVEFIDDDDLHALLRNPEGAWPKKLEKLQMIDCEGNIYPAHLPNFYDMCGLVDLHNVFNSKLGTFDYNELNTISKIVPTFIVDPVPSIPTKYPVYRFISKPVYIRIGFVTDLMLVFHVHGQMTSVDFLVSSSHFMVVYPTSRYYSIRFTVSNEPNVPSLPIGTPIIVWNVRDVARPSFKRNLHVITKKHKPDVVILTETRSSEANWTTLYNERISATMHETGKEGLGLFGGVIIPWERGSVDCETGWTVGWQKSEILGFGSIKAPTAGTLGALGSYTRVGGKTFFGFLSLLAAL